MASKNPVIYQTMRSVSNPIGDGRHNRSNTASPLTKNIIPAGFVFAINEDGSIEDRSKPVETCPANRKGIDALRQQLMSVATAPLQVVEPEVETVESIVAERPDVAIDVLKRLGVTPAALRQLLSGSASPSTEAQP